MYKFIGILILAGSVAAGWFWMDYKGFMNSRADLPIDGINIDVKDGDTLASISYSLYQQGVFRSTIYPRLAAKINPELTHIKRGEYFIDSHMTPHDILQKLVSGKVIAYQIRFIEGWIFDEFLSTLSSDKRLINDLTDNSKQQIADKLGLQSTELNNNNILEGWFYPDTFNFHKGASTLQILKVSHNMMKQKLEYYWNERDLGLPYDDPYQVLIMASIIEKETGLAGERDRIAGVFVRRLNKNMRLQTDPTVIYGMGDNFDGDLRRADLLADTPYNTYRRKGLPPTPIAMPSEASLSAAVHPAEGTELYFVARGDGSHQFSSTLGEHNQAVYKYQINNRN